MLREPVNQDGSAELPCEPATEARGPLAHIRVLEIAGIGPGPYACMLLADMGAEVVRIERYDAHATSAPKDPMLRSRRAITLDLKNPAAVDVVLRIAARSDVLVEGFRPQVAERLGLGPEVCCKLNPKLIYGRITGWGQTGPLARTAGHDINYLALSGLLHQIGSRDGKPEPPLNALGDFGGGGMLLAFGILCALQERSHSGRGQIIDTAIIDGAASFMSAPLGLQAQGIWRDEQAGQNFLSGAAHFYGTYQTRDRRWVAVGAIEAKFHSVLIEKLGLDKAEFAGGVGFSASRYDALLDDIWPRLRERLAEAFLRFDRDQIVAMFDGSDACVTPVLTMEEAKMHPHNIVRNTFIEVAGMSQNAPAPRFSRSVPPPPRAPRAPNSDAEAILRECKLSDLEIAALRESGAMPGFSESQPSALAVK